MFKIRDLILFIVILLCLENISYASDWGMFGDQDKLKNHTIVDVGNVSKISTPYGITWAVELYKLNDRCLGFSGYNDPALYSSAAAMLLIDNSNNIKLAILEDSTSIEVKLFSVSLYKCPYGTTAEEQIEISVKGVQRVEQQISEQLEALKKQQEKYELLQEKKKKLDEQ